MPGSPSSEAPVVRKDPAGSEFAVIGAPVLERGMTVVWDYDAIRRGHVWAIQGHTPVIGFLPDALVEGDEG